MSCEVQLIKVCELLWGGEAEGVAEVLSIIRGVMAGYPLQCLRTVDLDLLFALEWSFWIGRRWRTVTRNRTFGKFLLLDLCPSAFQSSFRTSLAPPTRTNCRGVLFFSWGKPSIRSCTKLNTCYKANMCWPYSCKNKTKVSQREAAYDLNEIMCRVLLVHGRF